MIRLKPDRRFKPCDEEDGDELFANGIFVFNITRLLAFVEAHSAEFPVERVQLDDLPHYGETNFGEKTIQTADVSPPILQAEIAPGFYNVIDGRHRVARALRDGSASVPARRIACPRHLPFLTSELAYERYVQYWNSKIDD